MSTETWDGIPKVVVTFDQLLGLYAYVPAWRGTATGPTIPFSTRRAVIEVNAIFVKTREEAEEAVRHHITRQCDIEGAVYDETKWSVAIELVGGS